MKSIIKTELDYTELEISDDVVYKEDYQQHMLRENEVQGLLKVTGRGIDSTCQYIYDITALDSLKQICSETTISKSVLELILKQILCTIEETRKYMLNVNCILLNPEYIFIKENKVRFCYYPIKQEELIISFRKLTEYIIQNIDYNCMEDIMFACKLHKETLDGSCTIDDVIHKNLQLDTKSTVNAYVGVTNKKEIGRNIASDNLQENIFDNQESQIKKVDNQKTKNKLKKGFWKTEKKNPWGNWDGLINKEDYSIINS